MSKSVYLYCINKKYLILAIRGYGRYNKNVKISQILLKYRGEHNNEKKYTTQKHGD